MCPGMLSVAAPPSLLRKAKSSPSPSIPINKQNSPPSYPLEKHSLFIFSSLHKILLSLKYSPLHLSFPAFKKLKFSSPFSFKNNFFPLPLKNILFYIFSFSSFLQYPLFSLFPFQFLFWPHRFLKFILFKKKILLSFSVYFSKHHFPFLLSDFVAFLRIFLLENESLLYFNKTQVNYSSSFKLLLFFPHLIYTMLDDILTFTYDKQ